MENKSELISRKVREVFVTNDRKAIKFICEDNFEVIAYADGDCCSVSWIENVEGVEQIIGKTILSIENVNMNKEPVESEEYEYLQFYGCKVVSDSGYMLIDYRNSSNGYYSGYLVWDHENFYGGVYAQNVADESGWRKVE
jgi:hypothetical protein